MKNVSNYLGLDGPEMLKESSIELIVSLIYIRRGLRV